MTDDELDALLAEATALANRPCSDCGTVTSPYQLAEVRVAGAPVRWLCWDCLHHLFDAEEDDRP
jgi:hypothetical protein